MLYCPKCANPAVEGQRFCRNCGTNLGLILDAMEGKRGPLDFESLKSDLRELGASLRSGFEEARQGIKRTQRFAEPGFSPVPQAPAAPTTPDVRAPVTAPVVVKPERAAASRQHSFQQATLNIVGGTASSAVLYYFFNTAANSGLLAAIVNSILKVYPDLDLSGVEPVFRMLWMFGLVGVAKGLAYLLNGIFFAPKPERVIIEQRPSAPVPTTAPTTAPSPARYIPPDNSITEEPTERLAGKTE